ncbi:MAG: MarR family winged helix-turn-helix transcriptional regulator [Kineosporiaceae bacterium]
MTPGGRGATADGRRATADGPGATRWLDAEEQAAWRAYLEGSARLQDHVGRMLDAHGLSLAEYEILVRLSEAAESCAEGLGQVRMSELASAVVHSRSRLTHTVTRMEAGGLVQRVADPADGRGVLCRMTPAGRDLLVATAPHHVTSVREGFLDALTREEFLALGAAMAKVAARLRC